MIWAATLVQIAYPPVLLYTWSVAEQRWILTRIPCSALPAAKAAKPLGIVESKPLPPAERPYRLNLAQPRSTAERFPYVATQLRDGKYERVHVDRLPLYRLFLGWAGARTKPGIDVAALMFELPLTVLIGGGLAVALGWGRSNAPHVLK